MSDINTLQEKINERAKIKAEKIVQDVIDTVYNSKLINTQIFDKCTIELKGTKNNLRSCFWSNGTRNQSLFQRELVKELTQKLIPEETELFISEIDELKNRVADLEFNHG